MIHFLHAELRQALLAIGANVEANVQNFAQTSEPCDCDLCTPPQCFCQDCQAERVEHQCQQPTTASIDSAGTSFSSRSWRSVVISETRSFLSTVVDKFAFGICSVN